MSQLTVPEKLLQRRRQQGIHQSSQLFAKTGAKRQSPQINGIEKKFSTRCEPVVKAIAKIGGHGATVAKHPERVNEVEGLRRKLGGVNVSPDQLYVRYRDPFLSYR